MKTVGIIGGLGPETTAEFYQEISYGCSKLNHIERPAIIIWSVPIRYEIEEEVIIHVKNEEKCLPYLTEAAQRLESAGVDFIVMPCNTLHIFIADIRKSVKVPVLSILDETAQFLKNNNIRQVGLIATSATLKRQIYETALAKQNIKPILPDDFDQAKLGRIITNLINNRHSNKDREVLINIINKFEQKGITDVILACTDLQLLVPSHPKLKIYDTMKILADATVREMLKDEK